MKRDQVWLVRKSFLKKIKTKQGGNWFRLPSGWKLHTSYSSSMASAELRPNLLDWTESDVHYWLSSIGFPQYETQIRGGPQRTLLFSFQSTDHSASHQRITSQAMSSLYLTLTHSRRLVLRRLASGFRSSNTSIMSNSTTTSPSNRTTISLRVCSYTPKAHISGLTHALFVAEADEKPEGLNVDKLYQLVREQGTVVIAYFNYQFIPLTSFRWSLFEAIRLRNLEFENRRLSEDVRSYVEDVNIVRASWSRMVRRRRCAWDESLTYLWFRAPMNLVPFNGRHRSIGISQNLASLLPRTTSSNRPTLPLSTSNMSFHVAAAHLLPPFPHHHRRCCIPVARATPLPRHSGLRQAGRVLTRR